MVDKLAGLESKLDLLLTERVNCMDDRVGERLASIERLLFDSAATAAAQKAVDEEKRQKEAYNVVAKEEEEGKNAVTFEENDDDNGDSIENLYKQRIQVLIQLTYFKRKTLK